MISKYLANCGYEIFCSNFSNYRKKLNIVLDYGVSRSEILKSLYALRYDTHVFVRRSEQMISVGIPIKMWYYQQPDETFNKYEQTHVNLYAITIIFLLFLYIFPLAF